MPTIVDSLIVELGLDPKKFTQGQKEALATFKKTGEEATKKAKDMEENARRAANFFSKVRNEAIGMLGAVAGAYGIKQFVSNLITGDAAVGRFARSTGMAVEEVAKFDKAIELAGGAPGAGKGALGQLNDQVQAFRAGLGGQILPIYNQMAAEGGKVIDINASLIQQMLAIAENAKTIEAKTPGRGGFFLRQLGFDENAINVLIRGQGYLQKMVDEAEKLGSATKDNADASEKLLSSWRSTSQLIQGLVRPLEEVAVKVLDAVNRKLEQAKKNQAEQYGRGPGAGQDKFNSWMNYIFGIKPSGAPRSPVASDNAPVPTTGGIFGGLNWKPMGWDDAAGGQGSTSTTEINVNGPITITTQADDAAGVAGSLKYELERLAGQRRLATQANSGQE